MVPTDWPKVARWDQGSSPSRRIVSAPMALRCVYTDLDGTLLGPRGGLFRDPDGNFSLTQAKALQACDRAGVEVVVMSGRRESEVASDSRLMGQTSYIYEAGCGVFIDGERTFLTGDWQPDENSTPYERMVEAGIPDLLFERYWPDARVALALGGRPQALVPHARQGRLGRGERAPGRRGSRGPSLPRQRRDQLPDGGGRGPHARLPPGARAERARRRGSSSTAAPAATTPRAASRSATRSRTSRRRRPSGGSSASRTGLRTTTRFARRCRASQT